MATVYSADLPAKPLYMQALADDPVINYTAAEFRNLNEAVFYTPGVVTPTSFLVEQADVVGWAIKVRPGYACTQGYFITSGADITLNLTALNTNPAGTRTHRVYLLVQDKVINNGTGYNAKIVVSEDTGSGATLPPSSASILLATFTISPGQSNIQNTHITARPRHASQSGPFVDVADYMTGYKSAHLVYATGPAQFRFGSGRIHMRGAIMQNSGSPFQKNSYSLGALPLIARPKYDVRVTAATSSSYPWRLYIAPDGTFTATLSPAAGDEPQYLFLDGVTYEID